MMNKEWSELNKTMQSQIKKKQTFQEGIETLILLRNQLMDQLRLFHDELSNEELCAIPFINADGYHSKTIAYSIWHIFRIEDIVAHTLIQKDEQVFFRDKYQERMGATIITTGNELIKQEIAEFSKKLYINELYNYAEAVKESTEEILRNLSFEELRRKMSNSDKEEVKELQVVSKDERASWLIDYWCQKNVKSLIQMPFSRHWIMHVEACCRIFNKIKK